MGLVVGRVAALGLEVDRDRDPCGAGPSRSRVRTSTDPDLSVASILETVADRSALEQVFHDVKEVHGAGQQLRRGQRRNLIGWWHTLVELWAWTGPVPVATERLAVGQARRRPSHANRCQSREALQEEYCRYRQSQIRRFIHAHPSRMRLTLKQAIPRHREDVKQLLEVGPMVFVVAPGDGHPCRLAPLSSSVASA